MIQTRIVEKYKGLYFKDFETEAEMDKYIEEHFEIIAMDIKKDGLWMPL
jgi:hypothetical protein